MIDLCQQFSGKANDLYSLYCDPEITDLLINGVESLYIEKNGVLESKRSPFERPSDLFDFIERLLFPIGKRIDAIHPYVDGRLVDGGRFHIILPPLATGGPYISIRKQRPLGTLSLSDFAGPSNTAATTLANTAAATPANPLAVVHWLKTAVKDRTNLLICGGTGSGKTSLLCQLIEAVSPLERIVIIEETTEIKARHPHLIHLESRPPTPEGIGRVTPRDLLRNALRMRPDRIVLGECRGEEAFDLLQALNSGHSGSLGTLHANSCLDALKRLESLVLMTGYDVNSRLIRQWIAGSIGAVIHLSQAGQLRYIDEIMEISGLEGENYRFRPIYNERSSLKNRLILPPMAMV